MGFESKIEWTTHTFNPWWGCTKVSEGCRFCYAKSLSNRFGYDVWGRERPRRLMSDSYWEQPTKWNRVAEETGERPRVFCASMADVFDEEAPDGQRERLWHIIRQTPMLDWQLLTKRPHLMEEYLPDDWGTFGYPNVWLGTSVEDQRVLARIEHLIRVPAVVHFLSVEPLIGPIPNLQLEGVNWVIVGGESGPGARPIEPEWVDDIKNQCDSHHVAFFFKQWGGVNKKATGREINGQTYNAFPTPRGRHPRVSRMRRVKTNAHRTHVALT